MLSLRLTLEGRTSVLPSFNLFASADYSQQAGGQYGWQGIGHGAGQGLGQYAFGGHGCGQHGCGGQQGAQGSQQLLELQLTRAKATAAIAAKEAIDFITKPLFLVIG